MVSGLSGLQSAAFARFDGGLSRWQAYLSPKRVKNGGQAVFFVLRGPFPAAHKFYEESEAR